MLKACDRNSCLTRSDNCMDRLSGKRYDVTERIRNTACGSKVAGCEKDMDIRMEYFGYLLSIKELVDGPDANELGKRACTKLDSDRLRKVETSGTGRKRVQCIGAGLLLQMGLQYGLQKECTEMCTEAERQDDAVWNNKIKHITIAEVLEKLGAPIEAEYSYGEKGKPCFKSIPLFFSISHSEDYVICVFAEQEIGADIQCCKKDHDTRMAKIMKRFFSQKEYERWENIPDADTRREFFYLLWTRKEAYGKLTGEGILPVVGMDTESCEEEKLQNVTWNDFMCWGDDEEKITYYLSVCMEKS